MARGASRAYVNVLAEYQDAALAGDPEALRLIREAHRLSQMTMAAVAPPPEPSENRSERQLRVIRSIA
ncbi:hypothetical protein [Streptomyces sp. NPDC002187]|uniref:hypothetical protein n=1 Tax=Streptomyces sp. NPDC002187 TaxID=3364637 RepID=UPI00367698CB